ncbi:MAG: hypothetical protein AAF204_03770 [Pseudomonadota bacterium]
MKLLRPRTFVIFALVGLSGAVLLHTSQNVQHAEERLQELELSNYREQEKIRMLRAEWENLNRPERLERLASEFLDLVPPTPEQISREGVTLPDPVFDEFGIEEQEERAFEPVLQPVSYQAPIPRVKPKPPATKAPIKKPETITKTDEKRGFDELINELGGTQGGAP